ncbi:MAG: hypothetical protein WCC74_02965 [Minisyncoccia bacterium]
MGFFKNIILKTALKSQLKGLPQDQQDKIIKAMEENPEFFENLAKKIEQKQKEGKDKTSAAMEVMRENQNELRKIMMG